MRELRYCRTCSKVTPLVEVSECCGSDFTDDSQTICAACHEHSGVKQVCDECGDEPSQNPALAEYAKDVLAKLTLAAMRSDRAVPIPQFIER
jgi:hypothetical protein